MRLFRKLRLTKDKDGNEDGGTSIIFGRSVVLVKGILKKESTYVAARVLGKINAKLLVKPIQMVDSKDPLTPVKSRLDEKILNSLYLVDLGSKDQYNQCLLAEKQLPRYSRVCKYFGMRQNVIDDPDSREDIKQLFKDVEDGGYGYISCITSFQSSYFYNDGLILIVGKPGQILQMVRLLEYKDSSAVRLRSFDKPLPFYIEKKDKNLNNYVIQSMDSIDLNDYSLEKEPIPNSKTLILKLSDKYDPSSIQFLASAPLQRHSGGDKFLKIVLTPDNSVELPGKYKNSEYSPYYSYSQGGILGPGSSNRIYYYISGYQKGYLSEAYLRNKKGYNDYQVEGYYKNEFPKTSWDPPKITFQSAIIGFPLSMGETGPTFDGGSIIVNVNDRMHQTEYDIRSRYSLEIDPLPPTFYNWGDGKGMTLINTPKTYNYIHYIDHDVWTVCWPGESEMDKPDKPTSEFVLPDNRFQDDDDESDANLDKRNGLARAGGTLSAVILGPAYMIRRQTDDSEETFTFTLNSGIANGFTTSSSDGAYGDLKTGAGVHMDGGIGFFGGIKANIGIEASYEYLRELTRETTQSIGEGYIFKWGSNTQLTGDGDNSIYPVDPDLMEGNNAAFAYYTGNTPAYVKRIYGLIHNNTESPGKEDYTWKFVDKFGGKSYNLSFTVPVTKIISSDMMLRKESVNLSDPGKRIEDSIYKNYYSRVLDGLGKRYYPTILSLKDKYFYFNNSLDRFYFTDAGKEKAQEWVKGIRDWQDKFFALPGTSNTLFDLIVTEIPLEDILDSNFDEKFEYDWAVTTYALNIKDKKSFTLQPNTTIDVSEEVKEIKAESHSYKAGIYMDSEVWGGGAGAELNMRAGYQGSQKTSTLSSTSKGFSIGFEPRQIEHKFFHEITSQYYVLYIRMAQLKSKLNELGCKERPLFIPKYCWENNSNYIFAFPYLKKGGVQMSSL